MPISQDKQRIKLTTPIGKDAFLVQNLNGHESVSKPFHFSFQVITEEEKVDQTKLIGKPVSCSIVMNNGKERFFSGLVSRLAVGGVVENKYRQYQIEMVPWLNLLAYRADCRIFQEKTVQQIVEEVFKGLGFNDFSWKLQGSYKPRQYCVQYRESDLAFVTRLLEEEGIFYFFKHEKDKHTLVLADYSKAYEKVGMDPLDVIDGIHTDHKISQWSHSYNFCSGKVSHTDYDFESPATSLMAEQHSIVDLPNIKQFEQYDYPGTYHEKSNGDNIARRKMEAIEATHNRVQAGSDYPDLAPGYTFKVGRHPDTTETKKTFVVATVTHQASEGSYRSGDSGSFSYSNQFECVPDDVVMRPKFTRPKPYISGSQTAIVVGPSSEEIYTDKYGRIKVQFYWDRLGKKDENSSCWIRVAQVWSGKKWGAQFIPRIGQEVLISFMEGDPDRPIVVGSVYNGEQMPTYDLPSNKAISGIKTRSTKSGGTENYNEIRFEDEKGKELFYLHAEKDERVVVENDQNISVGNDAAESIGNNSSETIGNDLSKSVGNDKSVSVGANHTESVAKAMSISVGDSRSLNVGKDHDISVGDNQTETVGKDAKLDVGGDLTETVSGKHSEKVTKDYALSAKKIQLSADDEILIKVGKAKIHMKKNGDITISGGKINVKGSGAVTIKGSKVNQN